MLITRVEHTSSTPQGCWLSWQPSPPASNPTTTRVQPLTVMQAAAPAARRGVASPGCSFAPRAAQAACITAHVLARSPSATATAAAAHAAATLLTAHQAGQVAASGLSHASHHRCCCCRKGYNPTPVQRGMAQGLC